MKGCVHNGNLCCIACEPKPHDEKMTLLAFTLKGGQPFGQATYYDCRKCGGRMALEAIIHIPTTIKASCQSCGHWVDLVFNQTRVCQL